MKTYQAYATGVKPIYGNTPQEVAVKFFIEHPSKRKCNILEGRLDGHFFVVTYGLTKDGEWPRSYKDVTRKTASDLPNN